MTGLRQNLQSKVAGVEGDFEQLLLRARFEEAKIRDLLSQSERHPGNGNASHSGARRSTLGGQTGKPTVGNRPNPREGADRCFTCHGVGHYAKNCPYKGRSAPAEARGKPPHQGGNTSNSSKQGSATTANLREGDDLNQKAKDKVAKLREELRAAELEVSLVENSVTTNVLHGSQDNPEEGKKMGRPIQGPIVEAEIYLEGHPTKALIDTGSPISIVSIDFLLQVLNRNRPEGTSNWAHSIKDKLQPPRMTVRNFGGGEVNVICQCAVSLAYGEHSCDATVLIQKGVSQGVLLGTDVLKKLGFRVLIPDTEGGTTDLLGTGSWHLQPMSQDVRSTRLEQADQGESVATVRLLQMCRIPARHCRLARVEVTSGFKEEMVIFYPRKEVTRDSGAPPAICVTQVGDIGRTVLSIENHSLHPVILEQGEVLGTLEPVHEVTTAGVVNAIWTEQGSQEPTINPSKRAEQLLSELNIEDTLGVQQLDQLKAVVSSFSDVFALDSSELGKTDLIKHRIDTGGQGPVRQLPYRKLMSHWIC